MSWPLRLLGAGWFGLPVLAGPALAASLEGRSTAVAATASALALAGWAVGLVALLVPRTLSLTALRLLAPAAAAAAAWVTVDSGVDVAGIAAIAATAASASLVLFVPTIIDHFVDGSSYGAERRFALRTPLPLLLGPVELAWALAVTGVAGPPLLAAAGQWAPAAGLAVVAVIALPLALPALHRLARRWLVFVPAGVVVHDPLPLADPILLPRRLIRRFGPAAADAPGQPGTIDLTAGASGLVLALETGEPVAVPRRSGRRGIVTAAATSILVAPLRPGAALAEAAQRRVRTAIPPPTTSSPS